MNLHITYTGLLWFFLIWAFWGGVTAAIAISTDTNTTVPTKLRRLFFLGPSGWIVPLLFYVAALFIVAVAKLRRRYGKAKTRAHA